MSNIKGDNQNFCNICNKKSDSLYTTHIYSSSKILILLLIREQNNNVKLNYSENIDITHYVLQKMNLNLLIVYME